MKLVFDEQYGQLSYAQRAIYRKHNVTPYEHDEMVRRFGEDAHGQIVSYVRASVERNDGIFRLF